MRLPMPLFLSLLPMASPWTMDRVEAQTATVIASDPVCRDCRLDLVRIATLGSADGPGALAGDPSSVSRDSRGRYYITQFVHGTQILVFDSTGRHLATLGHEGDGPGEYRYIARAAVGSSDSIFVFDNGGARLTILDSDNRFARAVRWPTTYTSGAVVLDDGRLVVNGPLPTAEGVGLPLHTLSPTGEVLHSFGSATGAVRPGLGLAMQRTIAPSRQPGIWAGHRTQYVLERWSTGGDLIRQFVRRPEWFEPYLERPVGGPAAPPPIVTGIREIARGRVMVLVGLSKPDFLARRGPPVRIEEGGAVYDLSMGQNLYDTFIEIIDTEKGQLLLSRRFELYNCGFIDDEHFCSLRANADGVPFIDIVRFRFHTPTEEDP